VTCLVGTFDLRARTLTYSNAGHPPGIVAGRDGIRHLNRGGPPAGLLAEAEFDQEQLQLQVGDACLVVTDGVTEALEGDTPLERDLEASWQRCGVKSAAELCRAVMARALSGHGPLGVQEWDDDRTVVVVKVSESTMVTGGHLINGWRSAPDSAVTTELNGPSCSSLVVGSDVVTRAVKAGTSSSSRQVRRMAG